MTKEQTNQWLKIAAYGIGAYIVYTELLEPILQQFGLQKTPEQQAVIDNQNATLQTSLSQAQATNPASYLPNQYAEYADAIYGTLESAFIYNENTVTSILKQMNNDTDIYMLVQAYGTRKHCYLIYIVCSDYTLSGAVTNGVSSSAIADVNMNYAGKGMSFRF